MPTINALPTIADPQPSDVLLMEQVSSGTTGKITVQSIAELVSSSVIVDTSAVISAAQAAGILLASQFVGTSGYMKRVTASTYSLVTTIQPSEISGATATGISLLQAGTAASAGTVLNLGTLATTSTAASAISYLNLGTLATTSTAASAQSFLGMSAFGVSMVSAGTATSVRTLLNLGTLATTSTAASAQSFLNMTAYGVSLVSAANAAAAGTLLNLGTLATTSTVASAQSYLNLGTLATTSTAASAKSYMGFATAATSSNVVVFDTATGGTRDSVVTIESAGSIYGYQGKLNTIAGSSYTVVSSDTGKILITTAAVTCSITLPNSMQQGFNSTLIQMGSGVIQFTAATSSTILQRQSYTKSAGQYAAVGLIVSENSNGTAAKYVLSGDMA